MGEIRSLEIRSYSITSKQSNLFPVPSLYPIASKVSTWDIWESAIKYVDVINKM